MKILRIRIALMVCIIMLPALAAGQPGAFLRYGVGGRALGMGRAFSAAADDATGIYWNPAGIMGAKRNEFHSMYSNLYYDSQFAFMGVVLPRLKSKYSFLNAFLGENSSIGFGWVNLSMVNFEQRTNRGEYLGDFGLQENAFIFAYAREYIGSWGILKAGFNLKYIMQGYPNLQAASNFGPEPKHNTFGSDLGVIFQPVHAPLFRIFSLKYLLPLQFGISLQNISRPGWKQGDGKIDRFPLIARTGASYRFIFRDWIPKSWTGLYHLTESYSVLLVYDYEWSKDIENGRYFGFEGYIPIAQNFTFYPRMGWNNQTEGMSFGFGITFPFTEKALMRLDYSNTNHHMLQTDNRFFLTVQTGKLFNAEFFKEKIKEKRKEGISGDDERIELYRILSDYSNKHVGFAAERLIEIEGDQWESRYIDLIGGMARAEWLFTDALNSMQEGEYKKVVRLASEAVRTYAEISREEFRDSQLLNYAESLIIDGQPENALSVLSGIPDSTLRMLYLTGISQKGVADWDNASQTFRKAVLLLIPDSTQRERFRMDLLNPDIDTLIGVMQSDSRFEEEQESNSMVALSFLALAKSQIRLEQYSSAIIVLNVIVDRYQKPLQDNYPRYPIYIDKHIVDDAQYLLGLCKILENPENFDDGVNAVLHTSRYFNSLECGKRVLKEIKPVWIKYMLAGESAEIINEAKEMINLYFDNQKWPIKE